jgi:hypothetical protein
MIGVGDDCDDDGIVYNYSYKIINITNAYCILFLWKIFQFSNVKLQYVLILTDTN